MKTTTLLSIFLITGIILAGCGTGAPVYTPTPPNTTTADLTNVSLKSEDLPAGIHRFTEDEIKSMGGDFTSMVKSFGGGASLVKTDLYGKDSKTVEFLFDAFFYPLSSDLIGKIDLGLSNPAGITQSINGSQVLPNLSGIGNGSMGFTVIIQGIKYNFLMIRRNNTLILLMEAYQSETSNFDLKSIGQKMDQYVLAEYK
jgi:hypothetical protein